MIPTNGQNARRQQADPSMPPLMPRDVGGGPQPRQQRSQQPMIPMPTNGKPRQQYPQQRTPQRRTLQQQMPQQRTPQPDVPQSSRRATQQQPRQAQKQQYQQQPMHQQPSRVSSQQRQSQQPLPPQQYARAQPQPCQPQYAANPQQNVAYRQPCYRQTQQQPRQNDPRVPQPNTNAQIPIGGRRRLPQQQSYQQSQMGYQYCQDNAPTRGQLPREQAPRNEQIAQRPIPQRDGYERSGTGCRAMDSGQSYDYAPANGKMVPVHGNTRGQVAANNAVLQNGSRGVTKVKFVPLAVGIVAVVLSLTAKTRTLATIVGCIAIVLGIVLLVKAPRSDGKHLVQAAGIIAGIVSIAAAFALSFVAASTTTLQRASTSSGTSTSSDTNGAADTAANDAGDNSESSAASSDATIDDISGNVSCDGHDYVIGTSLMRDFEAGTGWNVDASSYTDATVVPAGQTLAIIPMRSDKYINSVMTLSVNNPSDSDANIADCPITAISIDCSHVSDTESTPVISTSGIKLGDTTIDQAKSILGDSCKGTSGNGWSPLSYTTDKEAKTLEITSCRDDGRVSSIMISFYVE